jgi:hypothetical protein
MVNEVIILGTLHSGHLRQKEYSLKVLKEIITTINPDIVLAEIPPDRFYIAQGEWVRNKKIREERVIQFPEYSDVIFPLSDKLNFEIIPVSAWTEQMAETREQKLYNIRNDPDRQDDWETYLVAKEKSADAIEANGRGADPLWINSAEYDDLLEIELKVYNQLFNDELGAGGWENINKAHYSLIKKALERFENKKILITFGVGHKGWLRKALSKIKTITLIDLAEAI